MIPSEEMSLTLNPMDFDEFYWALGNEVTPTQLRQVFEMKRPVGETLHRRWMRDLRLYMYFAGMV